MKMLQQIIIITIAMFLFTACDNREIVEEILPCDYTFTVTPEMTDLVLSDFGTGVSTAIELNITKQNNNVSCDAKYTMTYEVKKGEIAVENLFSHAGNENDMSSNTIGTFVTSEIGTYTIKFTITNTEAYENKEQTKIITINVTYPPIVLEFHVESPVQDGGEVFVTKDAEYKFSVSGGKPGVGTYIGELTRAGGNLNEDFTVGGLPFALDTEYPDLVDPIAFTIKPKEVGEASYTLTVWQQGIVPITIDFVLKSKAPEFDIVLNFGNMQAPNPNTNNADNPNVEIDASNNQRRTLKVKIKNFTEGYGGSTPLMHYTYAIEEGEFNVNNQNTPSNGPNASRGHPIPGSKYKFFIRSKSNPGATPPYYLDIKEIKVTATNTEYGFSKTESIWIKVVE